MRNTLAVAATTAALVLTPTAAALADQPADASAATGVVLAQDTTEDRDQESDKTGLWGLLGLAGLAGLIKRRTTTTDHTGVR